MNVSHWCHLVDPYCQNTTLNGLSFKQCFAATLWNLLVLKPFQSGFQLRMNLCPCASRGNSNSLTSHPAADFLPGVFVWLLLGQKKRASRQAVALGHEGAQAGRRRVARRVPDQLLRRVVAALPRDAHLNIQHYFLGASSNQEHLC